MARARLAVVVEQGRPVSVGARLTERLSADHFDGLEKFEAQLWRIADDLRANSGLASNEYFMPIMGLIFLRYATNRFYEAKAAIEKDQAAGRMPARPLVEADFRKRRALMLPDVARYDALLKLPKDGKISPTSPSSPLRSRSSEWVM